MKPFSLPPGCATESSAQAAKENDYCYAMALPKGGPVGPPPKRKPIIETGDKYMFSSVAISFNIYSHSSN